MFLKHMISNPIVIFGILPTLFRLIDYPYTRYVNYIMMLNITTLPDVYCI